MIADLIKRITAKRILMFIMTVKEILSGFFHGNKTFSPKTIEKERIAICLDCEEYSKKKDMCLICGCFMKTKVKFKSAKCALDSRGEEPKW